MYKMRYDFTLRFTSKSMHSFKYQPKYDGSLDTASSPLTLEGNSSDEVLSNENGFSDADEEDYETSGADDEMPLSDMVHWRLLFGCISDGAYPFILHSNI